MAFEKLAEEASMHISLTMHAKEWLPLDNLALKVSLCSQCPPRGGSACPGPPSLPLSNTYIVTPYSVKPDSVKPYSMTPCIVKQKQERCLHVYAYDGGVLVVSEWGKTKFPSSCTMQMMNSERHKASRPIQTSNKSILTCPQWRSRGHAQQPAAC